MNTDLDGPPPLPQEWKVENTRRELAMLQRRLLEVDPDSPEFDHRLREIYRLESEIYDLRHK